MSPLLGISCFATALLGTLSPLHGSAAPVISVVKAEIKSDGSVQLHLSAIIPPNAQVSDAIYEGTHYLGGGGFGTGGDGPVTTTLAFYLHSQGKPQIDETMATWTKRLRVKEGDTFTLIKGKRLYFYDFKDTDQTRDYGYIEWNS